MAEDTNVSLLPGVMIIPERYQDFRSLKSFEYRRRSGSLGLIPLAVVLWGWMGIVLDGIAISYTQPLSRLHPEHMWLIATALMLEYNCGSWCFACVVVKSTARNIDKHICKRLAGRDYALINSQRRARSVDAPSRWGQLCQKICLVPAQA